MYSDALSRDPAKLYSEQTEATNGIYSHPCKRLAWRC